MIYINGVYISPAELLIDAAGDTLYGSAADTLAKLAKGNDDDVWTLASGIPSWAAPAGATLTIGDTEVFDGASPAAWTDLDLSGVVGSNEALVVLKIYVPAAAGISHTYAVRKNGDTDEFYANDMEGAAAGLLVRAAHIVLITLTDSNGKIEWKAEGSKPNVTVDVMSYIK